ncbi:MULTISPECIES: hypothetical protein [Lysinibacillus]|uniref:hypothetical protein n=1 Tax=Lysinibacillus TaxID=400634 RepID=UPI00214CADDE|nr:MULTISPECIES: hypothetical protein [Lysinibacillus]UUV25983.1 hypothetical protein NP781_05010 [Lysinibacillus sp. FN11]UYB48856.1 hypothetical protein OCI51_07800 [Lysinibacillus capsici]
MESVKINIKCETGIFDRDEVEMNQYLELVDEDVSKLLPDNKFIGVKVIIEK